MKFSCGFPQQEPGKVRMYIEKWQDLYGEHCFWKDGGVHKKNRNSLLRFPADYCVNLISCIVRRGLSPKQSFC